MYILIKAKNSKKNKIKIKIIYKEVISGCDLQRAEGQSVQGCPLKLDGVWMIVPLLWDMMDALTRAKLKWQRIQLIVFP